MTDPSPETDADSDPSQTPGESGEHEPSDGAWKDIPLSDYRDLFASMVHFSMKTANSNAEAGGIRLTSASALKGRYLCVRTQLGAGQPVALDYQKNAGIAATLAKQLRAAQANIQAARANYFPAISLTASAGQLSNSLSQLFDLGTWAWTFAPKLLLSVFDGGQRDAAVASQQIARNTSVAQYDRAVQTAFREVADALTTQASLKQQARQQQTLLESAQAQEKLARLRYEGGVTSFLEMLEAQRQLYTAQQARITTRLAQLQAQSRLYSVLGGGVAAER